METMQVPVELLAQLARTWSEYTPLTRENQVMNIAIIQFLNETLWNENAVITKADADV